MKPSQKKVVLVAIAYLCSVALVVLGLAQLYHVFMWTDALNLIRQSNVDYLFVDTILNYTVILGGGYLMFVTYLATKIKST